MNADLDEARSQHAALKQIIERHVGESTDFRALRRLLEHCRRAAAAIDDRYCRDKLRLVEDFAAELLSHGEHRRWDRESVSGVQFLKNQVLGALELFHSRLYSIEALRRGAAKAAQAARVESLRF